MSGDAEARRLVAEALGLEPEAVDDGISVTTSTDWSSLAHLRLVLLIEEHIGRPLDPTEIVGLGGLADVVAILEASGA